MSFGILSRITTGYNPAQVQRTLRTLNDAFNDLQDALINVTQTQFVVPMSSLWCSQEAVNFFRNKFQPALDTLNKNAYKTFSQIVSVINASAMKWAQTTGNTYDFTKIDFTAVLKTLDVSMIVDKNADGDIGVDEIEAMAKTGILLTKTFIKAQAALTKTLVAITMCGFLGKEQSESLKEAVRIINKNLENTIIELVKATKQSITATITAYSQVAKSISSSLSEISGINTNFGITNGGTTNMMPSDGARPTVQQPVVDTVVQQPAVDTPVVSQPTVDTPVVSQPTVDTPVVSQPTVDTPAVNQPAVDTPAVNQPAVDTPVVSQPTVDTTITDIFVE